MFALHDGFGIDDCWIHLTEVTVRNDIIMKKDRVIETMLFQLENACNSYNKYCSKECTDEEFVKRDMRSYYEGAIEALSGSITLITYKYFKFNRYGDFFEYKSFTFDDITYVMIAR